jgi:glutamate/tyrosine decarboxylase-like PLP-dependent enzyme
VTSITIDPHKLGYIPYACGAFIARNQEFYECHHARAPYLKPAPGNWEATIEGSRSAAGATAVWLTSQALGFHRFGFGRILTKTLEARDLFMEALSEVPHTCLGASRDTNILCFAIAKKGEKLAKVNATTSALFSRIEEGPEFSVSRTVLGQNDYAAFIADFCRQYDIVNDGSDLFFLRLVLMNPFICSHETNTAFAKEFARLLREEIGKFQPEGPLPMNYNELK